MSGMVGEVQKAPPFPSIEHLEPGILAPMGLPLLTSKQRPMGSFPQDAPAS